MAKRSCVRVPLQARETELALGSNRNRATGSAHWPSARAANVHNAQGYSHWHSIIDYLPLSHALLLTRYATVCKATLPIPRAVCLNRWLLPFADGGCAQLCVLCLWYRNAAKSTLHSVKQHRCRHKYTRRRSTHTHKPAPHGHPPRRKPFLCSVDTQHRPSTHALAYGSSILNADGLLL